MESIVQKRTQARKKEAPCFSRTPKRSVEEQRKQGTGDNDKQKGTLFTFVLFSPFCRFPLSDPLKQPRHPAEPTPLFSRVRIAKLTLRVQRRVRRLASLAMGSVKGLYATLQTRAQNKTFLRSKGSCLLSSNRDGIFIGGDVFSPSRG